MGFIDGNFVKLVTSVVRAQQWERCNVLVLGWILSSLYPELYLGQVYYEIVSVVWEELQETYDKMDDVIFNVIHKINGLKQGELFVPDHYHTCVAHEGVLKHNHLVRHMYESHRFMWRVVQGNGRIHEDLELKRINSSS
ncbi:hypothetical protein Tco_1450934 [Tanacetum coccineum]